MPSGGLATRVRRRRQRKNRKRLERINKKLMDNAKDGFIPFKTLTQYEQSRRGRKLKVAKEIVQPTSEVLDERVVDSSRQKFIERKNKQAKRKQQAAEAKRKRDERAQKNAGLKLTGRPEHSNGEGKN